VDDDVDVREALQCLCERWLDSKDMSSLPEFLKSELPCATTCLVLDVRVRGRSGLDFQQELSAANLDVPIKFITGHRDIPMSVKAMKRGAIEFLTKPISGSGPARRDSGGPSARQGALRSEGELVALREFLHSLTSREREAMAHVVIGRLNRQISSYFGISEMTIKIHRDKSYVR
jgi:FixJ family two-component response regulator